MGTIAKENVDLLNSIKERMKEVDDDIKKSQQENPVNSLRYLKESRESHCHSL